MPVGYYKPASLARLRFARAYRGKATCGRDDRGLYWCCYSSPCWRRHTPRSRSGQPGGISGTITDSTGGVLPGANVTATCTETNQARTAVSDTQGGFDFPELPVCLYRVNAELPGFKTVARDGLEAGGSAVTR